MNKSRLLVEYLLDRRAGVLTNYSVPKQTTYLTLPSTARQREGGDGSEDCAITRFRLVMASRMKAGLSLRLLLPAA
ncbi:hypothetical protein [Aminobacter ciceronei]|uniref:Uncharacterized protein n=1 Tax=Aminobacter ciceronei TaxID=150723 RepID=A0ABR6CH16_9HYPH|nr:hypothetical protein [Aminobacter ciceronei]MBA8910539.1 hypothetical protein [Aminobacter ciceronei]MBA9024310.1 hypothetical protein [Aminobacter ciceronei]